ncbi:MAG TPA: anhydro-N-acetylmuramic acid kinase [Rubrivivax sp.]
MLYIGLMSGTSLDGVDGVLVDGLESPRPQVLAHHHGAYDGPLRETLLRLNQPAAGELHQAALASNAVARCYAAVVAQLLTAAGRTPGEVTAIGAHGQTVRHRPHEFDLTGYTVQLLNGHLLAELSGIDVVFDLRGRDVAAGGEGAPLVPAFHAAIFANPAQDIAVLNLGGIANLTLLPAHGDVLGFDCGPGNALMDGWCEAHLGHRFDDAGRWAAGGVVQEGLLASLMADPFFARPPPKSTGRDLFHRAWLETALARLAVAPSAQDVQATLAEFSASAAADALCRHAPATRRLLVCGGGAFNHHLMVRLGARLAGVDVRTTDAEGVPADQVEALAFAWLAQAFVQRRPGNLPSVTGAAGLRVLGSLCPAG